MSRETQITVALDTLETALCLAGLLALTSQDQDHSPVPKVVTNLMDKLEESLTKEGP